MKYTRIDMNNCLLKLKKKHLCQVVKKDSKALVTLLRQQNLQKGFIETRNDTQIFI